MAWRSRARAQETAYSQATESAMFTLIEADMAEITLLRNPWESALSELLSTPETFLLLASPFVPIHLPALHAKVFVADYKLAIITSGNLTHGGIKRNHEYGVALRTSKIVRQVRADFENYAHLGAALSVSDITDLSLEFAELKAEYRAGQRKTLRVAGAEFKKKLNLAEEKILRFRARGKSNQSIFCDTIEYLLSNGPLRTVDLHPLVQQIHPDLCNDSEDRIIDGVRFGKANDRVSYDGLRWHLIRH